MYRLILVAGLALGLVACGGEDQQAADQAADMIEEVSFADQQAAFLADYLQGEGTHPTRSGLMYRIEREGDGASPGPRDVVEVHYEGRLVDGTVFDSSYEQDETSEFHLDRVIRGWTEGLQYMQVGAKYQFVIPPDLGYGGRTDVDVIPPNSVLIFDIELFSVTPVE